MVDQSMIKSLKNNHFVVFVGWDKLMTAKAKEIGIVNFLQLSNNVWVSLRERDTFCNHLAYRLREDYTEPEAGVEKCEVKPDEDSTLRYLQGDVRTPICDAVNESNFIGYLFENGWITSNPRLYVADGKGYPSVGTIRVTVEPETIGTYKVLTPTHVLFRKA